MGVREVEITRKCMNGKNKEKSIFSSYQETKAGEPPWWGVEGGLGVSRQHYGASGLLQNTGS